MKLSLHLHALLTLAHSMMANSKGNWGIGEYFILFSASRKRFKIFLNSVSLKIAACSPSF